MIERLIRGVGALVLGVLSAFFLGVVGETIALRPRGLSPIPVILVSETGLSAAGSVWYLVGFRWVLAVLGAAVGVGFYAPKIG